MGRWEALPDLKRAELVEGVVYVGSPQSLDHGTNDHVACVWLGHYGLNTPGCVGGLNATWFMQESVPQPDQFLAIRPEFGGQWRVEGKYAAGAPELAVEVCLSSASRDRGPKLGLYRRAGVLEYLSFEVRPKRIVWLHLSSGAYQPILAGPDGIFRSLVFPGLWLNEAAFWAGDGPALLATLQGGMATPEYLAFAERLRNNRV